MTSGQAGFAAAAMKPIDPEVLRLVRASATRLAPFADDFAWRLHADVVSLVPNLASAMADRGRPFCERMARAALWVALTDQSPAEIAAELRQAGADNWREGFAEADYVSVAHALVRAIRSLTESEWITSMGSAWISCFLWMQPHLVAGARQPDQAARPASRRPAPRPASSLRPTPPSRPAPASVTPTSRPAPAPAPATRTPATPAQSQAGRPDPEPRAGSLDDEDDDEIGYGQLMVSMTLNSRRDRPHH